MAYERFQPEELILRDKLAIDRTRLANERTLLAYLRTAIMLWVTGGTLIKLFGSSQAGLVSGWVVVALGVLVAAVGGWRFLQLRRRLA